MKLWGAMIVRDEFDPWLQLSLNSLVATVDDVIVIADKPDERTMALLMNAGCNIIHHRYDHESKGADGRQRNAYLSWLQKHALGDWVLVLDSDEVLSDNSYLYRELMMDERNAGECHSLRIRHAVWTLGLEDATVPEHYVGRRLFKVTKDLSYTEVEHPVLQGVTNDALYDGAQIWHFSRTRGVFEERAKLAKQRIKSNIHSKEQLDHWRRMWIFGQAPVKQFNKSELPKSVREAFDL